MEIERFCIWQDDRAMLQKMITGYNQYSTVIMESAGEMMNTKKDYGWILGKSQSFVISITIILIM